MTAPIIPGAEPFSADGGPQGALVLHGFTGNPRVDARRRRGVGRGRVHRRPPAAPGPRHRGRGHDPDRLVGLVRMRRGGVREAARPLRVGRGRRPVDGRRAHAQLGGRAPRDRRDRLHQRGRHRRRRGWPRACRRCSTRARRRWTGIGSDIADPDVVELGLRADAAPSAAHDVRSRARASRSGSPGSPARSS